MWCCGFHPCWLVLILLMMLKVKAAVDVEKAVAMTLLCWFQGGPSKQAQAQLSGLFNSITSFFHPSNHGRWLVSRFSFLWMTVELKKTHNFTKRIYLSKCKYFIKVIKFKLLLKWYIWLYIRGNLLPLCWPASQKHPICILYTVSARISTTTNVQFLIGIFF